MPKLEQTYASRFKTPVVKFRPVYLKPSSHTSQKVFLLILCNLESPETMKRGIKLLKQYGPLTFPQSEKAFVIIFNHLGNDSTRDYAVKKITKLYEAGQIPDIFALNFILINHVLGNPSQFDLGFLKIALKLVTPDIANLWESVYTIFEKFVLANIRKTFYLSIREELWEAAVAIIQRGLNPEYAQGLLEHVNFGNYRKTEKTKALIERFEKILSEYYS